MNGRNSNNATNAREEDAPGSQVVIEGTPLQRQKCVLSALILLIIRRGYASSFDWLGHQDNETTRDRCGLWSTHIVAIDALVSRSMVSQLRPGE